jgi:hypothetical protein
MTSIRVELCTDAGTREEQWNISRRFALVCHNINKKQSQYVFDNQGLLTKSFSGKEGQLTLLVDGTIPLTNEFDWYLNKEIPTNVEDQQLRLSEDLIMERVLNLFRA